MIVTGNKHLFDKKAAKLDRWENWKESFILIFKVLTLNLITDTVKKTHTHKDSQMLKKEKYLPP